MILWVDWDLALWFSVILALLLSRSCSQMQAGPLPSSSPSPFIPTFCRASRSQQKCYFLQAATPDCRNGSLPLYSELLLHNPHHTCGVWFIVYVPYRLWASWGQDHAHLSITSSSVSYIAPCLKGVQKKFQWMEWTKPSFSVQKLPFLPNPKHLFFLGCIK